MFIFWLILTYFNLTYCSKFFLNLFLNANYGSIELSFVCFIYLNWFIKTDSFKLIHKLIYLSPIYSNRSTQTDLLKLLLNDFKIIIFLILIRSFQFYRTKWKRQTSVGYELLNDPNNLLAVQNSSPFFLAALQHQAAFAASRGYFG